MVRCFEALTRDQVPRESLPTLLVGELPAAVTNGLAAALLVAVVGLWQGGVGPATLVAVSVAATGLAVAIQLPILAIGVVLRRRTAGSGHREDPA
jgi:Mg/Co/Ni transporter MgtE